MEPEFYGDLVYKLKKIVGSNNCSTQFIKIISHYKKIGYNMNVLQQTNTWCSTQSRLATLVVVRPIGVYLLAFFAPVFRFIYCCPYICFISFLYLDLYVLGDDALIGKESCMQTKYLYDLIDNWTEDEVGAVRLV